MTIDYSVPTFLENPVAFPNKLFPLGTDQIINQLHLTALLYSRWVVG